MAFEQVINRSLTYDWECNKENKGREVFDQERKEKKQKPCYWGILGEKENEDFHSFYGTCRKWKKKRKITSHFTYHIPHLLLKILLWQTKRIHECSSVHLLFLFLLFPSKYSEQKQFQSFLLKYFLFLSMFFFTSTELRKSSTISFYYYELHSRAQ